MPAVPFHPRTGLGGRFVFRWQESNLQSISLELLSAGFRSCSHTPYLKRFYQVAVSFYQLIKLHRNHKNKRCIFSEGAATLISPLFAFITNAFRKLSRTLTCFHLLDIAEFHGCTCYRVVRWSGELQRPVMSMSRCARHLNLSCLSVGVRLESHVALQSNLVGIDTDNGELLNREILGLSDLHLRDGCLDLALPYYCSFHFCSYLCVNNYDYGCKGKTIFLHSKKNILILQNL